MNPAPQGAPSPRSIGGRATGVLFFSGFGALWLCAGLSALHLLTLPRLLAALAVPVLALAWPALRLMKSMPPADAYPRDVEEEARIGRVFGRVNTAQWIGIVLVVVALNLMRRPELIVPAVAFIVGLHLFPLARLFHNPPHYVTGAALVLWGVATPLVFTGNKLPGYGALGAAAILLLSAAYNLRTAFLAARSLIAVDA